MIYLIFLSTTFADAGTVQVNGTVSGCEGQPVMVEILRPLESGQHPLLVWSGVLNDGDGDFSVSVPAQLGDTLLRAAVDIELNGIGLNDAQTREPVPLNIETHSIDGVVLAIEPPPEAIPETTLDP